MDSNPKIASLAARIVESNHPDRHRRNRHEEEEDDDEALFAELEAEIENDSNAALREQGLDVLRREMERMQEMKRNEHGNYTEISDEKEVVRVSANEPRCVVHFYHTKFKRCEIMDKHLGILAKKYFSTRFSRVFVENVPWLVERLGIKVLPCVICFVDGVSKDRLRERGSWNVRHPQKDVCDFLDIDEASLITVAKAMPMECVYQPQSFSGMELPNTPLVMAYYPDWAGTSCPPETIAFALFDWIDFAFALPTRSFGISWDSDETPKLLTRLVAAAHAKGKKVKLSVGGWTGSKAVATEESRDLFANNILNVYKQFELDGIDLDWEYPGHEGAAGNQVDSQDSNNFVLFLRRLRAVLPPGARITAAAQTVPFTDPSGEPMQDVSQFAELLDWLLLMNYDVWSSSPNPGPNAPLYDGCQNSTQPEANAVAAYNKWTSAGFPASQLVLGLPTYGYISSSDATSLRQRRSPSRQSRKGGSNQFDPVVKVVGEDGQSEGQVLFRELVRQGALVQTQPTDVNNSAYFDGAGGFERHWDSCSSTPYLRSASTHQIVAYDDPESLGKKAAFAKETGLLGVNLFDTHGDTDQWDLTVTVRKALGVYSDPDA
ncbi:hypothetical protein D9615_000516 [Tricholomella constricta]|uniref:GH18 domain-containing protein n=1 Tax=Tricholomella constricta TaxID=117010 RepID=A0A8H5HRP9_9AGAR|nr:hypothetical protein D9615_000516 [Tricholomella constricta]